MIYETKQIKGKGRGRELGFPTINLEIPLHFKEKDGVYAGWVTIGHSKYKAAVHFGASPSFNDEHKKLEAYLIDILSDDLEKYYTIPIHLELVEYVRSVQKFPTVQKLVDQIQKDVDQITEILYQ